MKETKIMKYQEEDQVLLIIYVLDLTSYYYAGIAFQFAVRYHYPDLQGIIDTDYVDYEGLELMNVLDDKVIGMIEDMVSRIGDTLSIIESVYNIDLSTTHANARVESLAEDFYWEFMCDTFPDGLGDHRDEDVDEEEYLTNWHHYILSLIRIVAALLDVISTGQVDSDELYEHYMLPDRWREPDTANYTYSYILNALLELGEQMECHLDDYYEYFLNHDGEM